MSNNHRNNIGLSSYPMTLNKKQGQEGQRAVAPIGLVAAMSSGMIGLTPRETKRVYGGTLRVTGRETLDSDMQFDTHSSSNGSQAVGAGSFGIDSFRSLRTTSTPRFRGTVAEHTGHSLGMMRSSNQRSNGLGLPLYSRSMTSGIEASLRLQQLQGQLALHQRPRAAASLVALYSAGTPMANSTHVTPVHRDTLLGTMPSQQVVQYLQSHAHQQRHTSLIPQPHAGGLNFREELMQAYLSRKHFETGTPRMVTGISHDMRTDRIKRSHQDMFAAMPVGNVMATSTPSLPARMLPSPLDVHVTQASIVSPSLPAVLFRPSDLTKLSQLQILLRQQVEAFCATEADVTTHVRGRNKSIRAGQVGLRCRHCAHVPSMLRGKGSTYFPTSVWGFYQASQNMCSVHLQSDVCHALPSFIQARFVELVAQRKEQKSGNSGAGREYWAMMGKQMGLVDMEDGVYFLHNLPAGVSLPVEKDSPGVYRASGGSKKMKLREV